VNVGAAYRWQDEIILGYGIKNDGTDADPDWSYDLDTRYYGEPESDVDLWIGYQRALTDDVNWRIQLNLRNAFADDKLIPVTVQPDGSAGGYRIKEGMSWFLTNTFTF